MAAAEIEAGPEPAEAASPTEINPKTGEADRQEASPAEVVEVEVKVEAPGTHRTHQRAVVIAITDTVRIRGIVWHP